jgi:hypothetical protein
VLIGLIRRSADAHKLKAALSSSLGAVAASEAIALDHAILETNSFDRRDLTKAITPVSIRAFIDGIFTWSVSRRSNGRDGHRFLTVTFFIFIVSAA